MSAWAIGGAAAGLIGDLWGSSQNAASQRETNWVNQVEAAKQREWQQMMAGTAHQREVSDLKKAGLNPILSAGGNGAATPSGAMATAQAPQITMPNVYEAISLLQNQQKIDNDKDVQLAAIGKTKQDTLTSKSRQEQIDQEKNQPWRILKDEAGQVLKKIIRGGKQNPLRNIQPMRDSPGSEPFMNQQGLP